MKVNVNVSAPVLNWIMARIDLEDLPEDMVKLLTHWHVDGKTPTFNQIERVSKATRIPLGYFFLKEPPVEDLTLIEYRTVDSVLLRTPSRNLIDTIHNMEQIQEWTREYLILEGAPEVPFIGRHRKQENIQKFAKTVRETIGLNIKWYEENQSARESFNNIRKLVSDVGVLVMMSGIVENNTHRRLEVNEFRAFTLIDQYAPLIFINSNDSWNGKLFSLLHELAHIFIGENSLFNDRDNTGKKVNKTEVQSNAVAAEILVPQTIFLNEWKSAIKDWEPSQAITFLSNHFNCGTTVIARKALDNNLIGYKLYETTAKNAVELYNKERKENKGASGGNFYNTVKSRTDKRFLQMLSNSVAEGKTAYSQAFRLTNTNRHTFSRLIDKIEG